MVDFEKSWDWVRPPPLLGPNSHLLPKICFEGFPNDGDEGDDDDDHGDDDDDGDDYDGLVLVGIR